MKTAIIIMFMILGCLIASSMHLDMPVYKAHIFRPIVGGMVGAIGALFIILVNKRK